MSIRIMNQVWGADFDSHAQKLVMLALADNANDEGHCWPAIPTIARKASVSERWVKKCIEELESKGWLRVFKRRGNSNYYQVTPRAPDSEVTSPLNLVPPGGEVSSPTPPPLGSPYPPHSVHLNHHEPPLEPSSEPPSLGAQDYYSEFSKFFDDFPPQRKGAKQPAFKAWQKAIKRDSVENILAGAAAYAKSDEVARGYAKGCAAWLNDDRWRNTYLPLEQKTEGNRNGKTDYSSILGAGLLANATPADGPGPAESSTAAANVPASFGQSNPIGIEYAGHHQAHR